jgi:hypothetical protein
MGRLMSWPIFFQGRSHPTTQFLSAWIRAIQASATQFKIVHRWIEEEQIYGHAF